MIESISILLGLPYGFFIYSDFAGVKLFGLVPWSVPLGFIPLLFGTMAIVTQYIQKPWLVILVSASLLVVVDLIIDPVFVQLGIWIWLTPGQYYGIPLVNFTGWFFTGLITCSVFWMLLKKMVNGSPKIPISVSISLILTLAFWSGFALWSQLVVPFILSIFVLGFLLKTFIRYLLVESDY
jgi:putative membrane protein